MKLLRKTTTWDCGSAFSKTDGDMTLEVSKLKLGLSRAFQIEHDSLQDFKIVDALK